ncbi:hypothetical protein Acr_00g0004750 [Actinidia rufa]|uniref:Integrase catalytic domain-containing protein n=1 Tax=Actinidia rufa TaxID=165716 RepID=A0A7J0D981_9ERIC|nr:hypothetical protein Acr_00g0004750 [Actinidia rufa]
MLLMWFSGAECGLGQARGCELEREVVGVEVKEAEVCVAAEGREAMREKVEVWTRRGKYCFKKLEEIPEEREGDVESDGSCCCCFEEERELGSDSGDCGEEERWAVDVGIWVSMEPRQVISTKLAEPPSECSSARQELAGTDSSSPLGEFSIFYAPAQPQLPRPSASSPLSNRSHPMAKTGQAPDLEGLHREIHDMAEQMRIMNENNGRLMQLLAATNPPLPAAPPSLISSNLATLIVQEIVLKILVPTESRRGGVLTEATISGHEISPPHKRFGILDARLDAINTGTNAPGCSDEVMCKLFSATLKGPARSWFRRLSPGTIDSFGDLSRLFVANFMSCRNRQKNASHLFTVHQNETESLKDFVKRFNQAILEVEDPSNKKETRYKRPDRDPKRSNNRRPRTPPRHPEFILPPLNAPVAQVLSKIKHEEFVKWPGKIKTDPQKRNRNKYCEFYRDHRHNTEDCFQLKEQIADLIKKGYLRKYVADRPPPNSPERRYGDNRPTAGNIQTIHGGFGSGGSSISSRKRHARSAFRLAEEEIYNLSSPYVGDQTPITFSNDNLRGLHLPHDDALVVSAVTANFNVQRILIDNRSSADILNQGNHLNLSPEGKVPHPNGDRRNQGRSKSIQTVLHFGHEGRDLFKSVCPIAITGRDVPGIDPEISVHKLFIDPKYSLVRQKRRKFAPERLKVIENENAGTTYQRLVNKMFKEQIGNTMEVYIDDMLVKSLRSSDHIAHLEEAFSILCRHRMMLNPSKCIFGVSSGKFLGFLVIKRGIEVNPDQIQALITMNSPRNVREVQQLTGRVAALNRFVSKSADKCLPFFKILRKSQTFQWNEESENAFQQLKEYLGSPPLLTVPTTGEDLYIYLSISPTAVSVVLIREEDQVQRPIYYVSKVLMGAEARYPRIEKLAYALMIAARKLCHYFQAHPIIVLTDQPLKHILQQPDTSGRLLKWSIELSEFHIEYKPRKAIKAQALADFIVESTHEDTPQPETTPPEAGIPKEPTSEKYLAHWILFVDGSSNQHDCGAGLVIQAPSSEQMEYAIRMGFKATNNEAEYEALLAGLRVATELGAQSLEVVSDSQLVVNQVQGSPCQGRKNDGLSGRASPSIGVTNQILQTEENPTWMDEIIAYFQRGILPKDKLQARRLQYRTARFCIFKGKLYKRSFLGPLLKCIRPEKAEYVLREIHEGICGNHSGARSLAKKTIRQGYFWLTIERDAATYIRRCDKCQRFAPISRLPHTEMVPMSSPWSFAQFGIPKVIISDNARQFDNDKFRLFCSDLAISHHFSSPGHPQANGQVEVTNRTILRNLKARLERSKSEWAEDLPSVLWAYNTTSRIPTGETPYSMVFGTESVIPVEIGMPNFRTSNFDKESNEVELRLNLDLLEEKREKAELRQMAYKCRVAKYYNQRVKHRSFLPGNLVLRKVTLSTKEPNTGKLGPTWEGPYKVVKVSRPGTYWFRRPKRKSTFTSLECRAFEKILSVR